MLWLIKPLVRLLGGCAQNGSHAVARYPMGNHGTFRGNGWAHMNAAGESGGFTLGFGGRFLQNRLFSLERNENTACG